MVGLFFYIDSNELNCKNFLVHAISESEAEHYGDKLTDFFGHAELFEQKFPNSQIEYFDFPRGRIVFDTVKNEYIIYTDKCLQTKTKIDKIKQLFKLENENCRVESDEHYVCKKCAGKIL